MFQKFQNGRKLLKSFCFECMEQMYTERIKLMMLLYILRSAGKGASEHGQEQGQDQQQVQDQLQGQEEGQEQVQEQTVGQGQG